MGEETVHYIRCAENAVILTLEEVLAKARAGEVNSLYIASTLKNGQVMSAVVLADDAPLFTLIGVIEAAKGRLLEKVDPGFGQSIDYGK